MFLLATTFWIGCWAKALWWSRKRESGRRKLSRAWPARVSLVASATYAGYGNQGAWQEGKELDGLFPFWRRDLWSK